MISLSQSILATLAYSDIFDYPLTEEEIYRWLVETTDWEINGNQNNSKATKVSPTDLKNNLSLLIKNKQIESLGDYYFLSARKHIIQVRLSHLKPSQEKHAIAQKAGKILAKIGWIQMVGITGSLAMNNCQKNDDVDLLIVTQNNRLWLVRPLATLLLLLSGLKVRRFGEERVKNKLCLNIFMEEGNLLVDKHNLFTAHEIAQIVPIYQNGNSYSKLINSNQWVNRFLVNHTLPTKLNETSLPGVSYINILIYYLNRLFHLMQQKYMQKKQTKEVVHLHHASFHPNILDNTIKNSFLTRLSTINKIAIGRVE